MHSSSRASDLSRFASMGAEAPYPNRHLGMAYALASEKYRYDHELIGAVALSNLRAGDRVHLPLIGNALIEHTDAGALIVSHRYGTDKIKPFSHRFRMICSGIGGALAAYGLGDEKEAMWADIFRRDPAAHTDEDGCLCLVDVEGASFLTPASSRFVRFFYTVLRDLHRQAVQAQLINDSVNDLKEHLRRINPAYPRHADGTPFRTAELNNKLLMVHLEFITALAGENGIVLEYTNETGEKKRGGETYFAA